MRPHTDPATTAVAGLSSVTPVPGVDPNALASWVSTVTSDAVAPLSARRLGVGQSNLTYAVSDSADRRWVLRRPPLGHLLSSAHDVVREARILSALEPTDVPAPRILGVVAAGEVGDAPLVLMEFVDGVVIDHVDIADQLTEHVRRAAGTALPQTLARIHAVDLRSVGLGDLASHSPYAARQLRRWAGQWEQVKTRDLPALEAMTARLYDAMPTHRETTLVHGDLHLRNIIVSPTTGRIAAALDWELSTLGDPLADLGTVLAYWPEPGELAVDGFQSSTLPGFPRRTELVEHYVAATGRDVSNAELGFWQALALWKIAIIAEGVRRRGLDEPRNRASTGTPDAKAIDDLVTLSHDVAAVSGI